MTHIPVFGIVLWTLACIGIGFVLALIMAMPRRKHFPPAPLPPPRVLPENRKETMRRTWGRGGITRPAENRWALAVETYELALATPWFAIKLMTGARYGLTEYTWGIIFWTGRDAAADQFAGDFRYRHLDDHTFTIRTTHQEELERSGQQRVMEGLWERRPIAGR